MRIMDRWFGVFVIHRKDIPFDQNDHIRVQGQGNTVDCIIRPGFKISAKHKDERKAGQVIEKAHVAVRTRGEGKAGDRDFGQGRLQNS